jgi:Pyruvate/2-oxoacid:ferredoxin oxidoreductase gamma subunit
MQNEVILQDVVIKFAGDSGDGMQLTGQQFTNNTALLGIDLATFPDFPAEIRAPLGTVPGVSGFQIHFSSNRVYTPGDVCDVLVAMNAAALKVNLKSLKKGGKIIANIEGFDTKNLRLAAYADGVNPLEDGSLDGYELVKVDVTKLTREALKEYTELGNKERDRAKNMFVLGLIYWIYNRNLETTIEFLKDQRPVSYDMNFIKDRASNSTSSSGASNTTENVNLDELYEDAKEIVLTEKKTSISYIQRRLRIGYNRAATIVEQLEQNGILSEVNAKGNREILS